MKELANNVPNDYFLGCGYVGTQEQQMRIILSSNFTHEETFSIKGYLKSHLLPQHIENTKILIFQKKVADLTYPDWKDKADAFWSLLD